MTHTVSSVAAVLVGVIWGGLHSVTWLRLNIPVLCGLMSRTAATDRPPKLDSAARRELVWFAGSLLGTGAFGGAFAWVDETILLPCYAIGLSVGFIPVLYLTLWKYLKYIFLLAFLLSAFAPRDHRALLNVKRAPVVTRTLERVRSDGRLDSRLLLRYEHPGVPELVRAQRSLVRHSGHARRTAVPGIATQPQLPAYLYQGTFDGHSSVAVAITSGVVQPPDAWFANSVLTSTETSGLGACNLATLTVATESGQAYQHFPSPDSTQELHELGWLASSGLSAASESASSWLDERLDTFVFFSTESETNRFSNVRGAQLCCSLWETRVEPAGAPAYGVANPGLVNVFRSGSNSQVRPVPNSGPLIQTQRR
jgi:hypothetical protein